MVESTLTSRVDRVQSLLLDLQSRVSELSNEEQDQVAVELEFVASALEKYEGSHEPGESEQFPTHTYANDGPGLTGSATWLAQALKQAKAGAWEWDLVHEIVTWSPGLYEILGMDPANEIKDPQRFMRMIHPEDLERVNQEFQAAVEQGGPFYQEFRVNCPNGKMVWLNSAGTVEHDAAGRPLRAGGINQDVTARKQAELGLRLSEERERARAAELNAIMDAVPAIIWIARDPECKEMIGNRFGYEFLKMWENANISKTAPEEDLKKQPYRNYKDGRELSGKEMPMQVAAATGVGAVDYEFDLIFENGDTKNLLGNVVPLFDQDGKPTGAVAAFVDITERKRVENELHLSTEQLKKWSEYLSIWSTSTNSFFWVLDPDGGYRDPMMTGRGVSGKPFEQMKEWSWIEAIHPDDRETAGAFWKEGIRQQRAFEFEGRVWNQRSEQYRWYTHRAVPIIAGTLQGWVGASIDIQAHKELEQALKEREERLRNSEMRFRVALTSAPITVYTLDKDMRYTWIYNPHHGFVADQMIGKRDDELNLPENIIELEEAKRAVMDSGRSLQTEIRVVIGDAEYFYFMAFDPSFDRSNQVNGMVVAALDVTELRNLEAYRREHEIQAAIQRRLYHIRENERIKIAREIHDGPIQTLVSAIYAIESLKQSVLESQVEVDASQVEESTRNAIQELRQVVNELRPPILVQFGLGKAIQKFVEELKQKHPEVDISVNLTCEGAALTEHTNEQINMNLYRICQEALHNVIRHSHATQAVISLACEPEQVSLEIQDNGDGFDFSGSFANLTMDNHFGLAGMKERAEVAGGLFKLFSRPAQGTKITVRIPLGK